MELIVEVVHPQVKLKATCKALTMGARLDFDAILQQTYFALCLWEWIFSLQRAPSATASVIYINELSLRRYVRSDALKNRR